MNNDVMNSVLTVLCSVTFEQIDSALSIILSIIMIVFWLTTLCISLYRALKDGKVTDEELEEIQDNLEKVSSQLDKGDKK